METSMRSYHEHMAKYQPSRATVEREQRRLRAIVNATDDPVDRRLAYAMANTLQWALGDAPETPTRDYWAELLLLRREIAK